MEWFAYNVNLYVIEYVTYGNHNTLYLWKIYYSCQQQISKEHVCGAWTFIMFIGILRMILCLVLACQGLCFSLLHMFFIPSMIHSSDRCGLQLGRMAATVYHFQLLCWARLTVSNWALDAQRTGCVLVTLGFNVWHTLFTCRAYKTTYFRIIRLCKKACHNSCEVMKGVWVVRKMFRCWMLS